MQTQCALTYQEERKFLLLGGGKSALKISRNMVLIFLRGTKSVICDIFLWLSLPLN